MASFNFSNFFESLGFTVTVLMLSWFSSLNLLSHQRCSRLNSFKHNIWADDSDLYISIRCYRAVDFCYSCKRAPSYVTLVKLHPLPANVPFIKKLLNFFPLHMNGTLTGNGFNISPGEFRTIFDIDFFFYINFKTLIILSSM